MYIDIHTHKEQSNDNDVLQVTNLYSGFDKASEGILCSIGLHPWYLQGGEEELDKLQQFAALSNVLAIGECGLDKVCDTDMMLQQSMFGKQIEIAKAVGKPLIIHCVRAYTEVVEQVEKIAPRVPVVFHGFNRNEHIADMLIEKGYYLSFGSAIMKDGATANVVRQIAADKLFCETVDATFAIAEIYKRVAEIRQVSIGEIERVVTENFKNVFKYHKI